MSVTDDYACQGYNVVVVTPAPQGRRGPQSRQHPKPNIHNSEATGLLIIAVLIFIVTLARYWHQIPWGWR